MVYHVLTGLFGVVLGNWFQLDVNRKCACDLMLYNVRSDRLRLSVRAINEWNWLPPSVALYLPSRCFKDFFATKLPMNAIKHSGTRAINMVFVFLSESLATK